MDSDEKMCGRCKHGNAHDLCGVCDDEYERLRTGHQRYETARRMNPRQWADAWKLNMTTGKPFDEIIDNMRPYMCPTPK